MTDSLTGMVLYDLLLLAAVASAVALALIALVDRWRAGRLSRLDPPTSAEFDEVRALRLAGAFRMPGRSSAMARHFEHSHPRSDRERGGGSTGAHEPRLTESWRDRRTEP